MKATFLVAGAALLALAGAAGAADLTPAPIYDWSGLYVGVNAGASFDNSSVENRVGGYFLTNPDAAAYQDQYQGSLSASGAGFTGGGEIGFNWQISNIVLGVEADINDSNLDSSSHRSYLLTAPFGGIEDQDFGYQSDWFGTVRARLGFAADRLLIYGTGGLAYGDVQASAHQAENGGAFYNWAGSTSKTQTGWTAGGGAEFAIDGNWLVGAEYLHVDLGTSRFDMPNSSGGIGGFTMSGHVDTKFDVVRATLKYKF